MEESMSVTLRGVNLGYMGLDKSLLANRPENVGTVYECPAIAYIVETPEGRILWETGLSARCTDEWMAEWQEVVDLDAVTPEACLEARLKEMGLGPDDFRCVVQGHLHTDHAGGLRLFEDAGVEIVVHEDEYAHVMSMESDGDFFARVDWAFLGDKKPTVVSDGGTELAGGVQLIHLPGHTPGQMAMQLQLENTGTVLLTSDALYHHENYVEPAGEPQIYWDIDKWRSSLGTLGKAARDNDAWLFPGHDETGIQHFDGRKELKAIRFEQGYTYA
jgi:glyoxylase-like metal-dependent hydrolase (beta-lactamase superfamily II)